MNKALDFGLYLVTDRNLAGSRSVESVIEAAVRGGVTAVQLREKALSIREFIATARRIQKIVGPRGIPLIINDRLDVALAVGAEGVHLGPKDIPYEDARRILGHGAIVGISVENAAQAVKAEEWDVDYLGVSPVFPTPTKTDTAAAWGLDGLRRMRKHSRHVLVAIGGINDSNAGQVLDAGADGLAVVSAVCAAVDPEAAARRLRKVLDLHRAKRS
ncbi:MAG: thiamine phosphate synthase [Candidatus Aminicenantales bacterium]